MASTRTKALLDDTLQKLSVLMATIHSKALLENTIAKILELPNDADALKFLQSQYPDRYELAEFVRIKMPQLIRNSRAVLITQLIEVLTDDGLNQVISELTIGWGRDLIILLHKSKNIPALKKLAKNLKYDVLIEYHDVLSIIIDIRPFLAKKAYDRICTGLSTTLNGTQFYRSVKNEHILTVRDLIATYILELPRDVKITNCVNIYTQNHPLNLFFRDIEESEHTAVMQLRNYIKSVGQNLATIAHNPDATITEKDFLAHNLKRCFQFLLPEYKTIIIQHMDTEALSQAIDNENYTDELFAKQLANTDDSTLLNLFQRLHKNTLMRLLKNHLSLIFSLKNKYLLATALAVFDNPELIEIISVPRQSTHLINLMDPQPLYDLLLNLIQDGLVTEPEALLTSASNGYFALFQLLLRSVDNVQLNQWLTLVVNQSCVLISKLENYSDVVALLTKLGHETLLRIYSGNYNAENFIPKYYLYTQDTLMDDILQMFAAKSFPFIMKGTFQLPGQTFSSGLYINILDSIYDHIQSFNGNLLLETLGIALTLGHPLHAFFQSRTSNTYYLIKRQFSLLVLDKIAQLQSAELLTEADHTNIQKVLVDIAPSNVAVSNFIQKSNKDVLLAILKKYTHGLDLFSAYDPEQMGVLLDKFTPEEFTDVHISFQDIFDQPTLSATKYSPLTLKKYFSLSNSVKLDQWLSTGWMNTFSETMHALLDKKDYCDALVILVQKLNPSTLNAWISYETNAFYLIADNLPVNITLNLIQDLDFDSLYRIMNRLNQSKLHETIEKNVLLRTGELIFLKTNEDHDRYYPVMNLEFAIQRQLLLGYIYTMPLDEQLTNLNKLFQNYEPLSHFLIPVQHAHDQIESELSKIELRQKIQFLIVKKLTMLTEISLNAEAIQFILRNLKEHCKLISAEACQKILSKLDTHTILLLTNNLGSNFRLATQDAYGDKFDLIYLTLLKDSKEYHIQRLLLDIALKSGSEETLMSTIENTRPIVVSAWTHSHQENSALSNIQIIALNFSLETLSRFLNKLNLLILSHNEYLIEFHPNSSKRMHEINKLYQLTRTRARIKIISDGSYAQSESLYAHGPTRINRETLYKDIFSLPVVEQMAFLSNLLNPSHPLHRFYDLQTDKSTNSYLLAAKKDRDTIITANLAAYPNSENIFEYLTFQDIRDTLILNADLSEKTLLAVIGKIPRIIFNATDTEMDALYIISSTINAEYYSATIAILLKIWNSTFQNWCVNLTNPERGLPYILAHFDKTAAVENPLKDAALKAITSGLSFEYLRNILLTYSTPEQKKSKTYSALKSEFTTAVGHMIAKGVEIEPSPQNDEFNYREIFLAFIETLNQSDRHKLLEEELDTGLFIQKFFNEPTGFKLTDEDTSSKDIFDQRLDIIRAHRDAEKESLRQMKHIYEIYENIALQAAGIQRNEDVMFFSTQCNSLLILQSWLSTKPLGEQDIYLELATQIRLFQDRGEKYAIVLSARTLSSLTNSSLPLNEMLKQDYANFYAALQIQKLISNPSVGVSSIQIPSVSGNRYYRFAQSSAAAEVDSILNDNDVSKAVPATHRFGL
jgi:hypothetical protein